MRYFSVFIKSGSRILDNFGGWILIGVMILIVSNVLLRALWGAPIRGTYEFVGLFTSLAIAFSIAYCAVKDGHIAVTFFVDKLSNKAKKNIQVFLNIITILFIGYISLQLFQYAGDLARRGDTTETTAIPLAPFLYFISLGFIILFFVLVVKVIETIKKEKTQ